MDLRYKCRFLTAYLLKAAKILQKYRLLIDHSGFANSEIYQNPGQILLSTKTEDLHRNETILEVGVKKPKINL